MEKDVISYKVNVILHIRLAGIEKKMLFPKNINNLLHKFEPQEITKQLQTHPKLQIYPRLLIRKA